MPKWTEEQINAFQLDGTNIIVSAGAGSGKTAVLTERVLRKVKDGVDIDKLLILTFTNAAAAEMKERIRLKLIENNLNEMLEKLDTAYITTFDAYALSIVKKYHYLLNVNNNLSICEASIMNIKKQELLDSVFEEMYNKKDPLFLKLIDDFCVKDDKDIKECILNINQKLDMMYNKEEYLERYTVHHFSKQFIKDKINLYIEILLDKIRIIEERLEELGNYVPIEYHNECERLLNDLINSNTYYSIKSSVVSLPRLPKNIEEEAKSIKESITSILKEITKLCCYENELEIENMLYKTADYITPILIIIKEFDKKLNNYKFQNDTYEFIDIAKMAIEIVEKNEFIRKDLSYNEIMVDEYQDTNDLQEKFISLIEDNNVYMVGDIKQSIYRFRNANPDLFKEKYNSYGNSNKGIKIDLNKNFRSRNEVLNNINIIFNIIMDENLGGANYKDSHQMIFGNNLYETNGKKNDNSDMNILLYPLNKEYKKEELEIFIIANDIKNKIENKYLVFDNNSLSNRGVEYQDIAILLDRTTNFELYKKIFEYMGIPLSLHKDEEISNHIDLLLIKNILGFIIEKDQTKKNYCFLSIMRSYLFNIEDDYIFDCIVNSDYSYLDFADKNISDKTPNEIIDSIITEFNFYEKIITVGDIDNHMEILDYIRTIASSLTDMGYDVLGFYQYLEKIINSGFSIRYPLNNGNGNSVKIMTIHKSKGLEFPICYYAGLTSKFNLNELKEKILYDSNLGIITPIFESGIRNTIYKDLLKKQYLESEISEKIRLLYVALTRAKEKMIIVLPTNDDNDRQIVNKDIKMSYRSFADIFYSIITNLSSYTIYINLENLNLTHDYNLVKNLDYKKVIPLTDEKIITKKFNFEIEKKEKKHYSKENNEIYTINTFQNVEYGKELHKFFETFDFKNKNISESTDERKKYINNFKSFGLFDDVLNIYQEYEFIDIDNEIKSKGCMDLLLEYDNEFKIIDYKLKNIGDKEYIKQLTGYKEYLKKMTNKPIKVYLYSILDNELTEIETI